MKKIFKIIFVQAPADLPFLLNLIEKEKNIEFNIYVLNVKSIFDFLNKINIKQVTYINNIKFNIRNPVSIILAKYKIDKIIRKNFNSIKKTDVYFFSRFEDWMTSTFVYHLKVNRNCNLFYINHYDFSSEFYERKIKIKNFIFKIVYKFITGVDFLFEIESKSPEFPISRINITEISPKLDFTLLKKYLFNINTSKSNLNVIIFVAPIENNYYDEKIYLKVLIKIIRFLNKRNYNVLIKGHPRNGLPKIEEKTLIFQTLNNTLPAEFINYENIHACIGVDTTILGFLSKYTEIPCYSYINLLKINDFNVVNSLQKYINRYSENKLINLNKNNLYYEFEKFKKINEQK